MKVRRSWFQTSVPLLGLLAVLAWVFAWSQVGQNQLAPLWLRTAAKTESEESPRSDAQLVLDTLASTKGNVLPNLDPAVQPPIRDQRSFPSQSAVARNPLAWLQRARDGDAVAALAVYQTLRRCRVAGQQHVVVVEGSFAIPDDLLATDCRSVPNVSETSIVDLLKGAASAGSQAAQFQFAIEILKRNEGLAKRGAPRDEQTESDTREAVRYLESLAVSGSSEAHLELAHAFSAGTAGEKDLARAFSYVVALSQIRPDRESTRVERELKEMLTVNELLRAQELSRQFLTTKTTSSRAPAGEERHQDTEPAGSAGTGSSAVPPL